MASFLQQKIDFSQHNEEVRQVMDSYNAGTPVRVPMVISGSITNYFHNPEINKKHYTFEQFFTDPDMQIRAQLEYQAWRRFNLLCDIEMGLPDCWYVSVDFQNSLDAEWAGCDITYQAPLPDTIPCLKEHKEKLYDMPKLLKVEDRFVKRGLDFIEYMQDTCKNMEFMGRPVQVAPYIPGEGTDGVLDLAYKMRGADNLLIDMMEDEEYFADLMDWITNNLANRIRTLRQKHCEKWGTTPEGFAFADDAICLISHNAYRENVLPYHKRLVDEFAGGKKIWLHLCGSNMHHFGGLAKELPIGTLDTGFPIDFDRLRDLVGKDVAIQGGPNVMLVKDGSKEELVAETKRILQTRAAREGRFMMIAANNLAPRTPIENIVAMYETVRTFGKY